MSSEEKKETKEPEISEWKGKPILVLDPDQKFPFQFGITKAKQILAKIPYIYNFVQDNCGDDKTVLAAFWAEVNEMKEVEKEGK